MGRPKDTFWWDLANKSPNGSLSCKFCGKKFEGGVSRIKLHLSGRGGNIGPCKKVPSEMKEKAREELRDTSVKSVRVNVAETGNMSSLAAMDIPSHNEASSSSSFNQSLRNGADQLVKFLINRNAPIDVFKDSIFKQFSAIIEKSLWNFEHEMNQYMKSVKESWKTTGCTLTLYDLNEGKGKFSAVNRYNVVAGFYCPRGFIFVEIDRPIIPECWCDYLSELDNAMKKYDLYFSWDEVVHVTRHAADTGKCRYKDSEFDDMDSCSSDCDYCTIVCDKIFHCMLDSLDCSFKFFIENSPWLRNLIEKTEKIYEDILDRWKCSGELQSTLRQKSLKQVAEGKYARSLSRLGSIVELKDDIRTWFSSEFEVTLDEELWSIVDDDAFWSDAKEVVVALTPFLRISHLLDSTLVPIGCYFQEAVEKAKAVLMAYHDRKPQNVTSPINEFHCSRSYLTGANPSSRSLSPYNCVKFGDQRDLDSTSYNVPRKLIRLERKEERETREEEWEVYKVKSCNPFANISTSESKGTHPVKLWERYGGEYPFLREHATKLLSQPGTCLSNQVEKCISQLYGSDNYILRLNAMMMEEFKKMEDKIFQPIDVDSILTSTWNT